MTITGVAGWRCFSCCMQLEPREPRHADVGHHAPAGALAGQRVERLLRGAEGAVRDALARERLLEHPADGAVVVDDPDRVHASFRQRQQDREARAAGHALELDEPVVLAHEGLREREPQAGAAFPPAHQRIEDPVVDLRRHARAVVLDRRPQFAWRWRCRAMVTWRAMRVTKRISPAPAGGLRGVARDVEDRLDQLLLVADQLGQARVVVALDLECRGTPRAAACARARAPRGC